MMIKTNRPAATGRKYWSATDGGVSVGAGVGSGASSTAKAVTECDG